MLRHRKVHRIDIVQVHLLQLGVLLVLLELLIAVCLVDFLGVDWELHHHVLALAVQGGVVSLGAVALITDLLHAHERAKTTYGSY